MNWLIVEDALLDFKGHWFEYLSAFRRGVRALEDEVTILADRRAKPLILDSLDAQAVLPRSIWHRMGDDAGGLRRLARVPVHACQTFRAVSSVLKKSPSAYDLIFVPTVLPHHLLGWYGLLKGPLLHQSVRILFYFSSTPVSQDCSGRAHMGTAPTARLLKWLLQKLRPQVESGRVVLGVETEAMRLALTAATGVRFTYLPQPVDIVASRPNSSESPDTNLTMACYGVARDEKGSGLLQRAIARHFRNHPATRSQFVIQWIDDFRDETGALVSKDPVLLADNRVKFITEYFREGDYARHLAATNIMLLPYRVSSYNLRGSRVVIEAMVNGIPVVATNGTTLADQAEEFGAVVRCDDDSVDSLCAAIETVERKYPELRVRALENMSRASDHFSVKHFKDILLNKAD